MKAVHEIRDALHVFIRLDSDERRILNSRPVQRLRHIHQLAFSFLVYPGATHRRFEHSLGVMELAGRVFDTVTKKPVPEAIRESLPQLQDPVQLQYWRRVVRIAALCHDIGHLPFSHAAEEELLPTGWNHERLTRELLESPEMAALLGDMTPPVRIEHVVKLAVGPRKAKDLTFSTWEALLSEVIVGDAFGVDRIDYLLRDSHHAGVAYGRFDHYRLLDTLCLLPSPPTGDDSDSREPVLGIEEGGLQSAEALLIARYMMYSQVYFHPVRRIYDIHLRDFLQAWLPDGRFSTATSDLLRMTDNEVTAAIWAAAEDDAKPGHDPAKRIVSRDHFRVVYARNPAHIQLNRQSVQLVFRAARDRFGTDKVRKDEYVPKASPAPDFPVLMRSGEVVSSVALSPVLSSLPTTAIGYVFVAPDIQREAESWVRSTGESLLQSASESKKDE